jgi:hypothetical protein
MNVLLLLTSAPGSPGSAIRLSALWLSGPEAMAQGAALRPDLVLMDIRLQGLMDGIKAAA